MTAHTWRPDAHFMSMACRPAEPAGKGPSARDRLAAALAELSGGKACRLWAAPGQERPRLAAGSPSVLATTLEIDGTGRLKATPLRAWCAEQAGQAHEGAGLVLVDNAQVGPWLARPIEAGADAVLEDLSSWVGVGGQAVIARTDALLAAALDELGIAEDGPSLPEEACREALRQLPLAALRTQRRSDGALAVASYLKAHPAVAWVSYPGLADDPANDAARRALDHGFGPLVTFGLVAGSPKAQEVLSRAQSLRCLEPASPAKPLTCARCDATLLCSLPWPGGMLIQVGLEEALDIVDDLEQALA